MLSETLKKIYDAGYYDNWSGTLIKNETTKAHETIRIMAGELTKIIIAPNASKENKAWAKSELEKLLK